MPNTQVKEPEIQVHGHVNQVQQAPQMSSTMINTSGQQVDPAQEAIGRYLSQIQEAKRIYDAGDEKRGSQMSNAARKELDKLGFDHETGAYARSNSYGQTMNQVLQGDERDAFINQYIEQILGAKNIYDQGQTKQGSQMSNQARAILNDLGVDTDTGYLARHTNYTQAQGGRMMEGMQQNLEGMYSSQLEEQQAMIEQNVQNAIADLERAYSEAVMQGELSRQEAEQQFQANADAIRQQAYLDAQQTNLSANSLGIQNSQQMLGFQAGDNARRNANMTTARTARDSRINEIKTRINNITNQKNIDTANVRAQGALQAQQTQAGLFGDYLQGMQGLQGMEYDQFNQNQRQIDGQNFQREMAEQERQARLEELAASHGYRLEELSQQQIYALEQMAQQQSNTLENMDVQQRHALEQMAKAHGYDLKKMDRGQLYEMQQMTHKHKQDLTILERQFQNNVSLANLQHSNNMNISEQEFNQAIALATRNSKLKIKEEREAYKVTRARELAKYTPGTKEYDIRSHQLDEEFDRIVRGIEATSLGEALTEIGGSQGGSYSNSIGGSSGKSEVPDWGWSAAQYSNQYLP